MNMRPTSLGQAMGARPTLSDLEFQRIANLAQSEYGIQIELQKKSMIQSRLIKRMRVLGIGDFSKYCEMVEARDSAERENFISAITTNVTHFYREVHHFKILQEDVLPPLIEKAKKGGNIRLWSAGCSTGQEPYSIAGSIFRVCPDANRYNIKVIATDLDNEVIEKAKAGRYAAEQCNVPGPEWGSQVFSGKANDGVQKIREDVASLVTFDQLNLNGNWRVEKKYDVIFCRNVAIYFDRNVQQRLWKRFADALSPKGALFIGHSERLSGPAKDIFQPNGVTAYRLSR